MIIQTDTTLQHYGVKGQKWGVRKKPTRQEQKRRSARQDASNRRRQLSDKDLNQIIERLNNEKKLKNLVEEDLRPGKAVAKKIMSESGQKVVRTVVAGSAMYAIKAAMTKKFDPQDAVNYIVPKPKK